MIAVLDPAIFWVRQPEGPLSPPEVAEFERRIDDAVRLCRHVPNLRIPGEDWYWGKLQREMIRPLLQRGASTRLKQGVDRLGQFARPLPATADEPPKSIRMWHVKPLFSWVGLSTDWLPVIERILLAAIAQDQPVIMIPRFITGRNQREHAERRSVLLEKERWRLYVHVTGRPPVHICCARCPRNLLVPWSTRFDEELPASSDGGHFPFCPPAGWWRRSVEAVRTIESKPAWVDRHGSGWARPATGGGYHWDVFIRSPGLQQSVGVSQINVARWGAPATEKPPGEIHHTPDDKQGRLNPNARWTCD